MPPKNHPFFITISVSLLSGLSFLQAGTDNETLGTNAGGGNYGNRNTILGDQAGSGISDTNENTIAGAYAGLSLLNNANSNQNTILGFRANGLYTQSEWEAFLAGADLPDIDNDGTAGIATANLGVAQNTYIGYEAGLRDYDGFHNTFIGHQAGKYHNYGSDNTFIGSKAGLNSHSIYGVGNAIDNTFVGSRAGEKNTYGQKNTFLGEDAGSYLSLGKYNVAVGSSALFSHYNDSFSNTSTGNTALGVYALYDSYNSWGNTAAGTSAGCDNGTGTLNTFLGMYAGSAIESASYNTFVGALSGADSQRNILPNTAERNTFVGIASGSYNREGNDNVFIGAFADMGDWSIVPAYQLEEDFYGVGPYTVGQPGAAQSTADLNVSQSVVLGSGSYVRGDDNVTVGYDIRSDAPRVIALGSGASVADATHENTILIGHGVQSRAANLAIIGNASTSGIEPGADGSTALGSTSYRFASATAKTFSTLADASANAHIQLTADAGTHNDDTWKLEAVNGGDFKLASFATGSYADILTASSNGNITVSGDLNINSDRRLKQDIQDTPNASALLSKLSGKSYHWKPDLGRDPRLQFGLIAQEVEAVLPELVTTSSEDIKSVNYQAFLPLLIDAVNEQAQLSTSIDSEIERLTQQISQQQQRISQLKQRR